MVPFDPTGDSTLSLRGPLASANRYRFSSKPIHEASGMYDYLYRWYIPYAQKWTSRDPLCAKPPASGSRSAKLVSLELNSSCFVRNSPLDLLDPFGLSPSSDHVDEVYSDCQSLADKYEGLAGGLTKWSKDTCKQLLGTVISDGKLVELICEQALDLPGDACRKVSIGLRAACWLAWKLGRGAAWWYDHAPAQFMEAI